MGWRNFPQAGRDDVSPASNQCPVGKAAAEQCHRADPQDSRAGQDTPSILEDVPATVATPETLAFRELLDARRDEFRALLIKYVATNPKLFGSVARGTAHEGSDIDILVEMDPADGNLLMRASGLMEETRLLFGRDDIDIFPVQLLKRPISESALTDAVAL